MSPQLKKKKKSKKGLIILLSILLFLAVVAGIIFIYASPAKRMQRQIDLGARYLSEQEYDQAIAAYEAALEIDPKSADAYIGLMQAYSEKGDPEGVRDSYERAKEALSEEQMIIVTNSYSKQLLELLQLLSANGDMLGVQRISELLEMIENTLNVNINEGDTNHIIDNESSTDSSGFDETDPSEADSNESTTNETGTNQTDTNATDINEDFIVGDSAPVENNDDDEEGDQGIREEAEPAGPDYEDISVYGIRNGTYLSTDGFYQEFRFFGDNGIVMSAFGIEAEGTYEIRDGKIIVSYVFLGHQVWKPSFSTDGDSIWIAGTEFLWIE